MRNFYISIGIWLILIPMLGISGIWKNRLVALTGFIVVSEALWPIIIRKISVKPRAVKKKLKTKEETTKETIKEEVIVDNFVENAPEKEGN